MAAIKDILAEWVDNNINNRRVVGKAWASRGICTATEDPRATAVAAAEWADSKNTALLHRAVAIKAAGLRAATNPRVLANPPVVVVVGCPLEEPGPRWVQMYVCLVLVG